MEYLGGSFLKYLARAKESSHAQAVIGTLFLIALNACLNVSRHFGPLNCPPIDFNPGGGDYIASRYAKVAQSCGRETLGVPARSVLISRQWSDSD